MDKQNEKPTLFDALGPGKTFWAGFFAALFAFCTIGFFVLLFGGGSLNLGLGSGDTVVFGQPNSASDTGAAMVDDQNNAGAAAQIQVAQVTSDDHVMGDLSTADIVVVEYSDFECPFCGRFHPTMEQVVEEYNGQVAWVYRHFPLTSIHPNAQGYAEAAECVAEFAGNDGFWNFGSALFEQQPSLAGLSALATQFGVDEAAFQECYDSGRYKAKVASQLQDATKAGAQGTPYSVVLNKAGETTPLSGALPIEQVRAVIDAAL